MSNPGVARTGRSALLDANVFGLRITPDDFRGVVAGVVVDHHQLEISNTRFLAYDAVDRLLDQVSSIVSRNNDRDQQLRHACSGRSADTTCQGSARARDPPA